MRTLVSNLLLLLSFAAFGQQRQKLVVFKKTNYPASKFLVTTDTSYLRQVQIITTMVTPKGNPGSGFLCRSWLTIRKNNKVLKQRFYNIEPVGGCSGLHLPGTQPLENYFIISKFGDYAGETLLIDTAGKLVELAGGSFSISADKKYLFSIWDSDAPGITTYDIASKKLLINKEPEGEQAYSDIYFQNGKYYVGFDDEITVGQINLGSKKIIEVRKSKGFLKKVNRLKVYNDIQTLPKCNCGRA